MEEEIKEHIEHLNKRIEFLEALLEVNSGTLEKAIKTNQILIEGLKKRAT